MPSGIYVAMPYDQPAGPRPTPLGLPIFPGLVRYDEVASGRIDHALRFTVALTSDSYIWPARHEASYSSNPNYPPMGLRLRLKASVNISGFPPQDQVILTALKAYGMIVADNGSNWYISGASDSRWNDDALNQLKTIPGSDFEVVDTSSLHGQSQILVRPAMRREPTFIRVCTGRRRMPAGTCRSEGHSDWRRESEISAGSVMIAFCSALAQPQEAERPGARKLGHHSHE